MGDLVSNLSLGFGVALSLQNLGLAFLGCLVGTLIGVLPGVGPIATIAMQPGCRAGIARIRQCRPAALPTSARATWQAAPR